MSKDLNIITPIWIRFTGDYDFQGIFDLIYAWFKRQGYELQESQYKDKAESWRGNEKEIKWEGDKKVTDYIKYWVRVHFHAFESRDIEVNGKTLHRGRVEINITAKLILDWQNTFTKGKVNQTLGNMYFAIKKREIDMVYEDQLYYQVYALQRQLKEKLGMTVTESAYG